MAIKDVKSYDYDAMVFLGGEGARLLFDDDSARKLAKDAKYKVIAASDKAVVLLSLADALDDKKVTGPSDSISWILKGKAQYTGEPIRVDDKLITVQEPAMSEQMANAVLAALEK
jgi:putative intracellular protease/amidase